MFHHPREGHQALKPTQILFCVSHFYDACLSSFRRFRRLLFVLFMQIWLHHHSSISLSQLASKRREKVKCFVCFWALKGFERRAQRDASSRSRKSAREATKVRCFISNSSFQCQSPSQCIKWISIRHSRVRHVPAVDCLMQALFFHNFMFTIATKMCCSRSKIEKERFVSKVRSCVAMVAMGTYCEQHKKRCWNFFSSAFKFALIKSFLSFCDGKLFFCLFSLNFFLPTSFVNDGSAAPFKCWRFLCEIKLKRNW